MNRALRTLVLPPPMKLLPRHWPDWRAKGARPTSAAICLRLRLPSSGSSAIRVREIAGPTEGTEDSRSSFSRQAGEPRTASSMSLSTLESSRSSAEIGPVLTLPLRADHVDDLTTAGDEIGELLGGLVRQRPWYDTRCLAKVSDHGGIDRVGLGALADGLGEGADLPRVGDRNRQAGPGEGCSYNGLQAAGDLEHDEVGLQDLETRSEVVEPGTRARDSKIFTTWTHGNIEAVLRYIDTNGDLLHGDPSLSKRARGAAPATVRVRWNGGRGAKLSNGLRGPKVRRTPARHRASLARRVG